MEDVFSMGTWEEAVTSFSGEDQEKRKWLEQFTEHCNEADRKKKARLG